MTRRKPKVGRAKGMLVAIGGAEQKDATGEPLILGRFVYVAGGRRADLVVIPTASSDEPGTGERYRKVFRHLGARNVQVARPGTRAAADDPELSQRIGRASGIFFTGGDQYRLSRRFWGSAAADAIREAHEAGVAVGGTSAGAAFLSEQMIAFGKSGSAPRPAMVTLAPGLGLTSRFIIDQHFRQRDRLGRLLTALASYPHAIGLGLDEDTAAFIAADALEVVGSGTITLVDAGRLRATVSAHADAHDPICMTDLRLHVLVHGATFDIHKRAAAPPPRAAAPSPP